MTAEEKRIQELADLKEVMSTDAGARFIYRLINDVCAYDMLLVQNSGSTMYFNLGEQNIGRIVKREVYQVALERWQAMERAVMQAREQDE